MCHLSCCLRFCITLKYLAERCKALQIVAFLLFYFPRSSQLFYRAVCAVSAHIPIFLYFNEMCITCGKCKCIWNKFTCLWKNAYKIPRRTSDWSTRSLTPDLFTYSLLYLLIRHTADWPTERVASTLASNSICSFLRCLLFVFAFVVVKMQIARNFFYRHKKEMQCNSRMQGVVAASSMSASCSM